MARRMSVRLNYYEALEVSPRASSDVIQVAYDFLIGQYTARSARGKQVREAGKTLLDANARSDYDNEKNNLEGKVIGQYRIIKEIASGGHATTYLGENIHVGEPVCIKHPHQYSAEDERILREETKNIWDLRHFSIPTMRDLVYLDDGSPMLVMSYIPGKTIEQLVTKLGKLKPIHVAWITERSLNALKYMHYHGVVHGDVKPQNIIVQPKSHTVVLVDYGLSLVRPDASTSAKGYTEYFSPPEQVRGDTPLPESDLFGLGITMIYMLGGEVATRKVPNYTPKSMQTLIKRFIRHDLTQRPNWREEDLCETIAEIRIKDFGARRSNMEPIPGVDDEDE